MQLSSRFIKRYLMPMVLLVLVFSTLLLIWILAGSGGGTWVFFSTLTGFAVIAGMLSLVIYRVILDEVDRKQAIDLARDAEDKYKALIETSTDGTLLVLDSSFVHANFVFLAMSGYTLEELHALPFSDLIQKKSDPDFSLDGFYREIGEIDTINLEAQIRRKKGDAREVILTVSKVRIEARDGIILIIKDMSGREMIEQQSVHLMNELQSSILLMNLPVTSFMREHLSCDMDLPIVEAVKQMQRKKQGCLIVMKDKQKPVGIMTDKDLRNRVIAGGKDLDAPVFEVMSSPLVSIPDQALLYEAILKIKEHGITHLAVEDKNARIVGIFSNEDLLEVQRNSISYLIKEVESADTIETLKAIHDKVPVLVKILLESGSKISNITYTISTITDAITHRLVEFAIEELGEPPARFAFVALGSEGRREQTLVTDQDNAIIFEDVPNERFGEVNKYFLYFGKKINLWLDKIGYQYCLGEVMAGNPQWCQPLERWKKYFTDWIGQKSKDGLLGVSVFFDFRVVYGASHFADDLRRHVNQSITGTEAFFRLMADDVGQYDVPSGIFKSNGSEEPSRTEEFFNIKNALSPLVDFIRVYSIQNHITETNSLQRLEKLLRLHLILEKDFHEIENIYSRLMEIRFRSHVHAILNNQAPDNNVRREELTAIEQTLVRKSFAEIIRFQQKIMEDFKL